MKIILREIVSTLYKFLLFTFLKIRTLFTELFLPTAILRDEDDAKVNKIMNGDVRKALNISRAWGTQSSWVFSALREDFMKPVTDVGNS